MKKFRNNMEELQIFIKHIHNIKSDIMRMFSSFSMLYDSYTNMGEPVIRQQYNLYPQIIDLPFRTL